MQLQIVAIGTRMPAWVQHAVDEYLKRMAVPIRPVWRELRAEPRTNTDIATCREREAQRIDAAIPKPAYRVLLDETGKRRTTTEFALRLAHWQSLSRPIALIIGGPDGVAPSVMQAADETLRLSDLTLPHPLVRVVLAEQLYRAQSVLDNHPYHRA